MISSSNTSESICPECKFELSDSLRYCPTCNRDVGFPNVRYCRSEENLIALENRYKDSKKIAKQKGSINEFKNFEKIIINKSGVVVSMPPSSARKLFEDPNSIYLNYERLVESGSRKPANFDNDKERSTVGGTLFGSYANKIIYGVLSLTQNGLPTYGGVHCRLRNIAIKRRTSFLVCNSYEFVESYSIKFDTKLPAGYMSCWEKRHFLVLSKLVDEIKQGQNESDLQSLLITSDGQNRKNDEFIEAHIYGNFDKNAIESIIEDSKIKLSKNEQLDVDIAKGLLKSS